MRRDLHKVLKSSFLSCEKDIETILKKLFIEDSAHAEELKRLLLINTKDCLRDRDSAVIKKVLAEKGGVMNLWEEGYLRAVPKIVMPENEEVKSYILITFDNFTPNSLNPEFRDCIVTFDIVCHTDYWDLGDFQQRPIKIMGYIDGILNNCRLSGIGTLQFMGAHELILSSQLSGYTLMYQAVHGSDDMVVPK